MKKGILFFLATFLLSFANAQTCMRDSSLLTTGQLVAPIPFNPNTNPNINTAPACINEFYVQSATLNVQESFTLSGFTAPLDSITMPTTGAITGLPLGVSYTCDPPSCHFKKITLGCILFKGTPTAANAPGNYELTIALKVFSPLLPAAIDLVFPGTVAPSDKFIIEVKPTGACAVSANDFNGKIASVKNTPNPFNGSTEIQIESLASGDFSFQVFDILGKRVYNDNIRLVEGANQFTFDAGDLANGTYFYSISNPDGKVSKMMVVGN
jgi:Secretion system C-terminal sorting domain